ncbi:MAG: P-loop NTPase fold protein [Psychromonas sp.]
MSIELVKEQVLEFLVNNEPQVLAIKGRWGIGKTFFWNQLVKENKSDIALKSYAYVSLFGANSLSDIKRTVFENTIDTVLIGEDDNLATIKKNYKSLGKKIGRKSSSVLKEFVKPASGIVLKGLGSSIDKAYESLAFATLDNTLICFDDLERHSDKVKLRDFLGLISFFKEQKNCKVVILLNEDSKGLEDYFLFKEKIIDKQLHFEPTAKECFDIAITEQDQYQHIHDICLRLDIRNIRVLKKIEVHVQAALKLVEKYDDRIRFQVVQSIIILCWCYYCHSSDEINIPNFIFVKSLHARYYSAEDFSDFLEENDEEVETKEKKWEQTLISFDYPSSDSLSPVLLKSIEQGFVDKDSLKAICDAKQNEIEIEKRNQVYSKGWEVFHNSFDANEEKVKEAMKNGLISAVQDLTGSQFSSGIGLIRDLDDEELAEELTDLFIEKNKLDIERLNIKSWDTNPFGVKDEKFGDKVQSYYDHQLEEDNPITILERRSNQNSYNQSEVAILEKLDVGELKELFKSFKGEELTRKIRACLMLAGSSEGLMDKTQKALKEIGNESALNKRRLEKFSK